MVPSPRFKNRSLTHYQGDHPKRGTVTGFPLKVATDIFLNSCTIQAQADLFMPKKRQPPHPMRYEGNRVR